MNVLGIGLEAAERGLVPDRLMRIAIRRLCRDRLRELGDKDNAARRVAQAAFVESMKSGPIAPVPEKANEQHYELPSDFFAAVLGPRRKYSCCYWSDATCSLAEAEEAALAITCDRAQLHDGQDVLELGCGWGSLSLWMAQRYPNSRITAVSNSSSQRRFIESQAADRGLNNLAVVTADMNDFAPAAIGCQSDRFDRVVSVEMFEHMRNFDLLLGRIASWLRPSGYLFVHTFCHRELAYPFETTGKADWMGRHFFTGGIMPSKDLLRHFDRHLSVVDQWSWSGDHYRRTAAAWLANLDARSDDALRILETTYGKAEGRRWLQRWRVFFLAVDELFGYGGGDQWHVSHCLMSRSSRQVD